MPAASMRGPPMPTTLSAGRCSRKARISWLPSRSPDASPATIAMVRGRPAGSADDATRRLGEKIQQYLQFGAVAYVRRDLLLRVFKSQARLVERLVRALDRGDRVGRKTAPLETFGVDAVRLRGVARRGHEGRNVLQHDRADRGNAVGADMAELVNRGESAEYRVVADFHVAGELRIIGEYRVVADLAVVCEMHVCHHPVIVTQPRDARILHGAAIESAEFADRIAVADFETRGLAGILLVLRRFAERDELKNAIVAADARVPGDDCMRAHAGTGIDFNVRADHGVRADLDAGGQPRAVVHYRCGMNRRHVARAGYAVGLSIVRSVHMRSASVTTWPSTFARVANHQMPRANRLISTLSSSVSPGITGWCGKWTAKKCSLIVTFLIATMPLPGSHDTTLSTSRKG